MPAVVYSSVAINGDTPQIFTGSNRTAGSPSGTGNPVAGDPVQAAALITVQATAVTNTIQPVALPLGARILAVTVLPNVAGTGGTPTIAIGSTSGASDIVAATAVAGAQVVMAIALNSARPLLVANFASIAASSAGGSVIFVTYNQASAPTAVGTYTLFIEYVMA
jgi:hypothetical protein